MSPHQRAIERVAKKYGIPGKVPEEPPSEWDQAQMAVVYIRGAQENNSPVYDLQFRSTGHICFTCKTLGREIQVSITPEKTIEHYSVESFEEFLDVDEEGDSESNIMDDTYF